MKSPSRYWREAATLILAGRSTPRSKHAAVNISYEDHSHSRSAEHSEPPEGKPNEPSPRAEDTRVQFDYKTLMLKRSNQSSFFAGMYVFPGGTVGRADFASEWDVIYKNIAGKSCADVGRDLEVPGLRPPMISTKRQGLTIPPDVGFRICAIRETFEESGILLASSSKQLVHKDKSTQGISIDKQGVWRDRVQEDSFQFLELCRTFDVVPNVWNLVEWNNWLTPALKTVTEPPARPRRFDTMFYICFLDSIEKAEHDSKEITNVKWVIPSEILDPDSKLAAIGPQVYEFSRLSNFTDLDSLMQYTYKRAPHGLLRNFNIYIGCKDGYAAILPGDELYPEEPDLEGLNPVMEVDMTLSELQKSTTRWNRQERYKDGRQLFTCNIELECGQVKPKGQITESTSMVKHSKL